MFLLKFKLKAFFCFLLFVLWVRYLKEAWMKTVVCSFFLDFLHFSFHCQMKTRFCFRLVEFLVCFQFLEKRKSGFFFSWRKKWRFWIYRCKYDQLRSVATFYSFPMVESMVAFCVGCKNSCYELRWRTLQNVAAFWCFSSKKWWLNLSGSSVLHLDIKWFLGVTDCCNMLYWQGMTPYCLVVYHHQLLGTF